MNVTMQTTKWMACVVLLASAACGGDSGEGKADTQAATQSGGPGGTGAGRAGWAAPGIVMTPEAPTTPPPAGMGGVGSPPIPCLPGRPCPGMMRATPPAAGFPGAGLPGSQGAPGAGGAAGVPGAPGMAMGAPAAGAAAPAGSAGAAAAAGAAAPAAPGDDEFAALRQVCVDYINMYRATLNLAPYKRGTPEQEACGDMGAKKDGDSMVAHGSARDGDCYRVGLSAQNTCPGYPARPTLEASMKMCLDQMWAEGEPMEGTAACIQDQSGCFQKHGHWINMTSTQSSAVACSFYKMTSGAYWMNQNFGR